MGREADCKPITEGIKADGSTRKETRSKYSQDWDGAKSQQTGSSSVVCWEKAYILQKVCDNDINNNSNNNNNNSNNIINSNKNNNIINLINNSNMLMLTQPIR